MLVNTITTTLTVPTHQATSTLTLNRYGDGTVEFLDPNGNKVRSLGSSLDRFFDALVSLFDALA